MDTFREYSPAPQYESIKAWLAARDDPYSDSQLYYPGPDQKVVDKAKRVSQYRTFTDKKIFGLADEMVQYYSDQDPYWDFTLVRNDVTQIRYEEGGFFKPHKDYLSLKTNHLTELTMIMCLDATGTGGETKFEFNPFFIHTSYNTIKPGHVVVFRKDLVHEGTPLSKDSTKQIITLNLRGTRKDQTDKIVVIQCTDDVYYVLKLEDTMNNTYFAAAVRFNGSKNCTEVAIKNTSEQFNSIYKILTGQHISMAEYDKSKSLLDYYCIEISNIIFDKADEAQCQSATYQIGPRTDQIIVAPTEAQMLYMYDQLDTNATNKVMKFRVLLCEGTSACDETVVTMTLQPYYIEVDDWVTHIKYALYDTRGDDHVVIDTFGIVPKSTKPLDLVLSDDYPYEVQELFNEVEHEKKPKQWCQCLPNFKEVKDKMFPQAYRHVCACQYNKICQAGNLLLQNIVEKVKREKTHYEFPQEASAIAHGFCNESVYGTLNSIMVYGLIFLEGDLAAPPHPLAQ